jgi:hypothetical protein
MTGYLIYIDGIPLEESKIEGLDAIVIKKVMSPTYWGYFLDDGFGFSTSSGAATITINDEQMSSYIKAIFERDGFSANVAVKIINQGSGQKAELLIDFSEYEEIDCCFVAVTLKPSGSGQLLLATEKIEYPIALTETIKVPVRPLPEAVNFSVDGSQRTTTDGGANHYIPLLVTEDSYENGTSRAVQIGSNTSLFTSSLSTCVRVIASIKVNVSSVATDTFSVYVKNGTLSVFIDTFPMTSVLTEQTITISEELDVLNGGDLSIYIESASTDYAFFYDNSSTGVSLSSCIDPTIQIKDVKAVSVKEAFKQIISRSTNSASSLGTYIFDECEFDGYLTNNEGLFGTTSTVNISLFKLFEELNNKYPISMDVIDENVNIHSRCSFLTCENPYELEPFEVKRAVFQENLYSDLKIGYNNWRADASFGAIEYNSTRQYESSFKISSNTLSLLNDWGGSGSIISEQIIKKKEKDEIHWIVVKKSELTAETNEYISSTVYLDEAAINLRITPARNLERWKKFLINDLKFISATGNSSITTTDTYDCGCFEGTGKVDESIDVTVNPILGKFLYTIILDSCGVDIKKLKGCVSFDYCGVIKKAFVTLVNYELKQGEDEQITIEAIELV